MITEFIYHLLDVDAIFYVGRSKDPEKREKQHRREGVLNRGTRKYEYISNLFENGKDFTLKVVQEIPEDGYAYDYEDFYVLQAYHGKHPIQNMKHGDLALRKRLGDDYKKCRFRTVQELQAHRITEEKKSEERRRTLKEELDRLSPHEREARDAKRYWNRILRLSPMEVIDQYMDMGRSIMVDLRDVCQRRVRKDARWEEVLCELFAEDFDILVNEFIELAEIPPKSYYQNEFCHVCRLEESRFTALQLAHGGHEEILCMMDDVMEEKKRFLRSLAETS